MGWTRSRRYANHSSGKKYSDTDKKTKKSKSELEKKAAKDAKDFNDRNKAHKLKTLTKEIAPCMGKFYIILFFIVLFIKKYLTFVI